MIGLRKEDIFRFLFQYHISLLVIIWLFFQLYLYHQYDLRIVPDSYRYLGAAEQLTQKFSISGGITNYATYVLLIFTILKIGLPVKSLLVVQVIISGLAAIFVNKITLKLSKNWLAAAFATFLFCTWTDLQHWNYYVHTDSLYCSLGLILLYLLLQELNFKTGLLLILCSITLIFIRPNGFIPVLSMLAFGFIKLQHKVKGNNKLLVWFCLGLVIAASVILVNAILKNISGIFSFQSYFEKGQIIQGYDNWIIEPENKLILPDENETPLIRLFQLVFRNLGYFLKLSAIKFVVYFSQLKPYYSTLHNVSVVLFMYPVYGFAVLALIKKKVNKNVLGFMLTFIGLHTAMVLASAIDWDNRFMMPNLPYIFILAGIGFSTFLKPYFPTFTPNRSSKPALP